MLWLVMNMLCFVNLVLMVCWKHLGLFWSAVIPHIEVGYCKHLMGVMDKVSTDYIMPQWN